LIKFCIYLRNGCVEIIKSRIKIAKNIVEALIKIIEAVQSRIEVAKKIAKIAKICESVFGFYWCKQTGGICFWVCLACFTRSGSARILTIAHCEVTPFAITICGLPRTRVKTINTYGVFASSLAP